MVRFLRRIISPEVRALFTPKPVPGRLGVNGGVSLTQQPSKARKLVAKQRRRRVRRAEIALKHKTLHMRHVFPPGQGSRRNEWSSPLVDQWATQDGITTSTPRKDMV